MVGVSSLVTQLHGNHSNSHRYQLCIIRYVQWCLLENTIRLLQGAGWVISETLKQQEVHSSCDCNWGLCFQHNQQSAQWSPVSGVSSPCEICVPSFVWLQGDYGLSFQWMWQAFEVASVLTEVTTQLWMATRAATGWNQEIYKDRVVSHVHTFSQDTAAVQSHGNFFTTIFSHQDVVATAVYSPPPTAAHFRAISVLC